MPSTTLVLLAAGLGSRYGGPKQLDPLGPDGSTLMDYAAFDAVRAGFTDLVVITRRSLRAQVESGLMARAGSRLRIEIAEQELDRIPAWASDRRAASHPGEPRTPYWWHANGSPRRSPS